VKHLLRLLVSAPYSDVVPFFQRSSCLSHLFTDVSCLILEDPEFLDTDELQTISGMLAQHEQAALIISLDAIKDQYPFLAPFCETKGHSIGLSQ
jgi:hypothetical protein